MILEINQLCDTLKTMQRLKSFFDKKVDGEPADSQPLLPPDEIQAKKEKLIREANWDDLLLSDKCKLLDGWSILSIIANIFQILGCIFTTFRDTFNLLVLADNMLGVGAMLAWFIILRYLLRTESYKSMLASFNKSLPFILRAIVSIIPLFLGYAFLGMSLFWESRRFADFTVSCYTLFALMHGDMIWDTYNDMIQIQSFSA